MHDALRAVLILLTFFLGLGMTIGTALADLPLWPAIVFTASSTGLVADWVPRKPRFMGWPVLIVALASAASALAAGVALRGGRLSLYWSLIALGACGASLGVSLGLAVRWLPRRKA